MGNGALAGQAIVDVDRLGALSDAAVTGRGQRQCHQLEQGVDKTFQGPQRQAEQALEHWRRFDGGIAVLETTARL